MILDSVGALHASQPHHGEVIREHDIYVAPSDYHMCLQNNAIWLDKGPKENFARPAADPLFRSAARSYGWRMVGIVLTGGDEDGAHGLQAVRDAGGITVVQGPDEALDPSMPQSGLILDDPDFCIPSTEMSELIISLCGAQDIA